MSRYLKQHEKEHMKMAMLKQEETFKQQVHELHRLYRVQRVLMTEANAMPAIIIRCNLEDERRNAGNDAGSSKSWGTCSEKREDVPVAIQDSELELTLALGCLRTAGKKVAKKETSSSVDSRTSNSSSSTESGSPDCRALLPLSLIGSAAAKPSAHVVNHLEQEGMQQPPWLHKCLNLAR